MRKITQKSKDIHFTYILVRLILLPSSKQQWRGLKIRLQMAAAQHGTLILGNKDQQNRNILIQFIGTIQTVLISYLVMVNFIVQSSVVIKPKINSEAVERLLH